ncbi:VOC family protein [Methylorubrum extorquens]
MRDIHPFYAFRVVRWNEVFANCNSYSVPQPDVTLNDNIQPSWPESLFKVFNPGRIDEGVGGHETGDAGEPSGCDVAVEGALTVQAASTAERVSVWRKESGAYSPLRYAHVQRHGIEIMSGINDVNPSLRTVFIKGPDGAIIELLQRLPRP